MSIFSIVAGGGLLIAALAASAEQILPGHVPEVISKEHLQPIGRLAETNRIHLVLGLALRNQAALTKLLADLYDPASPLYHHYLTPAQFTEQFGPTTNDYQAAIDFAKKNRLEPETPHDSRLLLDVRGQPADIEAAFHVHLQTYRHPTETRIFYAPDREPAVEDGLPVVEIQGLSDFAKVRTAGHARKTAGKAGTAGGSGLDGYYIGKDFRNAYVPGATQVGSGQVVGLFEIDGYYASDITAYESNAGMTNVPLQNVLIDGFSGTPQNGLNDEVALDIEMAVSMAPALAKVVVFEAPDNTSDWLDVLDSMANNTQISQFSSSCGYTGGSNPYTVCDAVLMKMAAQGQSFFQAAGDGDAWTSTIWVPAASPYLTCVGGTSLTMTTGGKAYTSETTWNSGSYTTNKLMTAGWSFNGNGYYGSGGGFSPAYAIPTWQSSLNMTTNHGSTSWRNIPDVSMVAINILLYYNNGVTDGTMIGTSCAAPLWAGFAALVNQQAAAGGKAPLGFFNPALYALTQRTNYSNLFHDITTGNTTWPGSPTNYYAVPGYDLCTGLGTPNGTNLISALLSTEVAPSITAPPASLAIAAGSAATFSVTAAGTAPLTYFWRCNGTFMSGQTNAAFTTNDVQSFNSGEQFSCLVSNALGTVTSQAATLTVAAAPTITASPTNETVATGGSATFNVTASGTAPLGYFWLCNGAFISGGTNAALTTNTLQLANSGQLFSCLVSNAIGSVTSAAASLTVETPPSLASSPTNQTAAVGASASFTVTASGTPLNYYWFCNGSFIAGQTNATLTTNNVQLANSGQQFSCLVSNAVGSVTSSAATLTVDVSPSIVTSPTDKTLSVGAVATFSVAATGTSLSYYWLCNGNFIAGQTNAAFSTNNVQLANSGQQFSCVVSNAVGSVTSAAATLTVETPPGLASSPTNQTVAVGTSATFAVTASGTPLNYYWFCNGSFIAGQTNATLITNNVQLADSGQQFSCLVSNAVGSVTTPAATLTVDTPPSIVTSPANLTIAVGSAATFTVAATGTSLNYYWLGNGIFIPGQTNTALITNNVQLANSGQQFSCVVSNAVGSAASAAATLTVEMPPGLASSPTNQTVAVGTSATFAVTASGTTLNYYWFCNGSFIAGQTNATLITNNVQLADSGQQFSCLVSNAVGSVTTPAATLTVDTPPSIVASPTNLTIAVGSAATFTVAATGTSLNYYWLGNGIFIPGQTNTALITNNVQLANSGQQFSCLVSNAVGKCVSQAAILTVAISKAQAPAFGVTTAGTNLIISGFNGVAGGTYSLLTSPDLTRPPAEWTPLTTNILDTGGAFAFTATNAVTPQASARYYMLEAH